MELATVNGRELHILPSKLAAACLTYSLQVVGQMDFADAWTRMMVNCTGIDMLDLEVSVEVLSEVVYRADRRKRHDNNQVAVTKKYCHKAYDQVAKLFESQVCNYSDRKLIC